MGDSTPWAWHNWNKHGMKILTSASLHNCKAIVSKLLLLLAYGSHCEFESHGVPQCGGHLSY